jgi:hypothetical protein
MANATNLVKSPHPNTLSKGSVQSGPTQLFGSDIWLNLVANGAPTAAQGAGWAAKGSTLVDGTTGKWYSNRGTTAAPNWVEFNNA